MDDARFNLCTDMPLTEWLARIEGRRGDASFWYWSFPTPAHASEFLASIESRPENAIRSVLRAFLIPSCSLGTDKQLLTNWVDSRQPNTILNRSYFDNSEFFRRLIESLDGGPGPWEGLSWILDLLPHNPHAAISVLSAYSTAHAQELPDGRGDGLYDAMEVIRARWIGTPKNPVETLDLLRQMDPRDFEHIVERLFRKRGYETTLTPRSKDGGRDVEAMLEEPGRRERLLVECKRYRASNVGVEYVRALLGVVSDGRATKGMLITTRDFTRPAQQFASGNHRLELINGHALIGLLNEAFGPRWTTQIDSIVTESKKSHGP